MEFFRNFTVPLWELFAGNLLLLICSLFYLVWWIVVFRPGATGVSSGTIYLILALLTGLIAVVMMIFAINSLSHVSKALPVKLILLGAALLYVLLLIATVSVFHRPVTSELLIIHIWAALELSAVTILYGIGRFGPGKTVTMAVLIGTASIIGMICYVLYYRLTGVPSYRDGMIPLASDALVMIVFLVMFMLS